MLRVRPVSQKETKANDDSIIQFPGEGQIWVRMIIRSIIVFVKQSLSDIDHGFDETMIIRYIIVLIKQRPKVDEAKGNLKPFTFNVVFEPEATQADVLEHSGMKRYLLSIY